ncbi:hypothetical protein [Faecalibacterium sp.]|uniref:hypothetical protein n=1 Tax=Faecalibacterium sp. TaxID=1971605 RepID=UPI00402975C8
MRLKSALRRGVAAAVIAGIVVSSGIPAYAARWDIADGDITVKADDADGTNRVTQGEQKDVKDTDTVITGKSDENTVTIDTSDGNVDVTFDDLKIDVSGKKEGNGSGDSPVRESNAAVTVQGDHDATIELDGKNELKSGGYNAGLEKNGHESEGTLTIKDDKGKDGSLTAEGGDGGGAGIGGGKESTGSNITIRGGTVEAVGGSSAAGIGDGAGRASDDTDDPNPGKLYICGDAEVTAKAGSQILDAKVPAIGGTYGEVPTESLSDADHKVTGGRLTRLNADGTVMEGMGYDYTSTPTPQPEEDEDDDDDVPPPAQENAPEPLPGGMVVKGFFASRVTIQQLDLSGVTESGIGPMVGSVKASDAGEVLAPGGAVLIESAAPRSTVTTDIPSLREDGVEDIFFRYQDTMTHYSVDKMADAAGEDADVELKQNREDISLRLDGETRDDLSERFRELWIPEVEEWLILTHEHEEVERKTSEELRRELDELLKQKREMDFQLAKKRDDLPSLDWWLEPAREETPGIGLDESLKQLAARFEAIAPEEDKKPLLVPVKPTVTERKKYTNPLESDLRSYTDLGDDWDDLPNMQGEIKLWIPEDLEKAKFWLPEELERLISPSKESPSGSDGIA